MKTQTVLVLLACLGIASAASPHASNCSRRLAAALDLLCERNSLVPAVINTNSLDMDPKAMDLRQKEEEASRRRKRQVVADCCQNPCTVNELMGYCYAA